MLFLNNPSCIQIARDNHLGDIRIHLKTGCAYLFPFLSGPSVLGLQFSEERITRWPVIIQLGYSEISPPLENTPLPHRLRRILFGGHSTEVMANRFPDYS